METMDSIKEVFYANFTEDNVDFKILADQFKFPTIASSSVGCEIIIHYNELTITNELNNSHKIHDLFVKVVFDVKGCLIGTFTINRSTFTDIEIKSNYLHSHCCRYPLSNIKEFSTTCLGNGPIVHTCVTLNQKFDLDIINLFCIELDKYLHVESLKGGPYRKIEHLCDESIWKEITQFESFDNEHDIRNILTYFKHFIIYVIENNVLNFVILSNHYELGMSFKETVKNLTNALVRFNEYYSVHDVNLKLDCDDMVAKSYLKPSILSDYGFKYLCTNTNGNSRIPVDNVVTFKGRKYQFTVIKTEKNIDYLEENQILTLNPEICYTIVQFVTRMKNLSMLQLPF